MKHVRREGDGERSRTKKEPNDLRTAVLSDSMGAVLDF